MAGHGWGGVELLRALREGQLLDFLDLLNRQDKWPFGFSLLLLPFLAAGHETFASATLLSTVLFTLVPALLLWTAREVDDGAVGSWGGALAGGLFLASPLHRVFAILVMRETAGVVFSLLALGLYLRARRLGTASAWRAAGIATLGLVLIKYNYALIWLAALLLHELWRLPREGRTALFDRAREWLRGARRRRPRQAVLAWLALLLAAFALGINPGFGIFAGLVAATVALALRWRRDPQALRGRWRALPLEARAGLATVVLPMWVWCLSPDPIHPRSIIGFLRNRATGPPLGSLDSLTYYGRMLLEEYAPDRSVGLVLVVVPLLALCRLARERAPWRLLLLVAGTGLIAATLHPYKEPRFLAVTAPLLMLVTGLTVARAAHGRPAASVGRRALAAVSCGAMLVLLCIVAIRSRPGERLAGGYRSNSSRPGWWRVLTFLEGASTGADRVAMVGSFNELSGDLVRWWLAMRSPTAGVTVVSDPPHLPPGVTATEASVRLERWFARARPQRIFAVRLLPSSRLFGRADFQRHSAGGLAAVAALERNPDWRVVRRRSFKGLSVEVTVLEPAAPAPARARWRSGRVASPSSPAPQRDPPMPGAEHQVVEKPHAEQLARVGETAGEGEILGRRRRIPARMGVEEQHAGRGAQQGLLEDGPRLDGGARQGATVQLRLAQQPIAHVEEERSHHLLVAVGVPQQEVPRHRFRVSQRQPVGQLGPRHSTRQLEGGEQAGDLGGTEPAPLQGARVERGETCEAAGGRQQVAAEVERRGPGAAGA